MMKLHWSQPWRRCFNSKLLQPLSFSTKALPSSSRSSRGSLSERVSQAGDPRVSIVGVVEQWVEEGRELKQADLQRLVKQLRKFRRFNHALQLCEWISNERNHDPSSGDIAIRLHLISKVHGLEQAEKYFNSIEESSRDYRIYGSLLNCYAEDKNLEKAEALMEKMRKAGFLKSPLPYNVVLSLYAQMGKHEKLDKLMEEMEEKKIAHDRFTYNIRLNAYVATSNVTNMEKILLKMDADPLITKNWHAYFIAANGYFKAGLSEKSIEMLKKSEQVIGDKHKWLPYECLISLYAAIGNKDEVYRVWSLYTNLKRRYNSGYLCIISSLMKLDDIEGAEKILKEWESGDTCFDFKIPNMMVKSYCSKGLLDKAEAYISRLMESGKEPQPNTWDRLATGYHADGQTMKAVETMKKAISASQPGWKPNYHTFAACLEYLKTNGNVEVAEEIVRLLSKHDLISAHINDRLVDYIRSENQTSSALDQFGLDVDGKIERLDHASDENKLDSAELQEYEETSDNKWKFFSHLSSLLVKPPHN